MIKEFTYESLFFYPRIPEILRPAIYCRIIQTNFQDEVWDFFWSLYEKDNPNNFDDILSALACTEDKNKLKE